MIKHGSSNLTQRTRSQGRRFVFYYFHSSFSVIDGDYLFDGDVTVNYNGKTVVLVGTRLAKVTVTGRDHGCLTFRLTVSGCAFLFVLLGREGNIHQDLLQTLAFIFYICCVFCVQFPAFPSLLLYRTVMCYSHIESKPSEFVPSFNVPALRLAGT